MEAKHTPGPWHESVGEIRSANGFCIATMEPPHPASKGKDRAEHRSYQKANAQLIATAPELLKALQTLLPMLAEWHQDFPDEVGDKEVPAINAARAAIEKAIDSDLGIYRGPSV